MERKMYASTTDQGTAMAETALCERHNTADERAFNGWGPYVDCTGNDALTCVVCGYPDEVTASA